LDLRKEMMVSGFGWEVKGETWGKTSRKSRQGRRMEIFI